MLQITQEEIEKVKTEIEHRPQVMAQALFGTMDIQKILEVVTTISLIMNKKINEKNDTN